MQGKKLKIIAIGRLKKSFWQDAAKHYLKRVQQYRKLEILELRDGDASLSTDMRKIQEGQRIIEKFTANDWPIALDEAGQKLDSPALARLLEDLDRSAHSPCLIIGGAHGLDAKILELARLRLSLSALTWPHELARVLLLEQIYRAECIRRNLPYHH